jgi:lipopolysaccharide/colanic/teichoic acid biosynthesis glycosyltransferase
MNLAEISQFKGKFIDLNEPDFFYRTTKRIIDILLAIALIPVFLLIAALLFMPIKFDSKGGVFFVQNRVGKNGRIFRMYKFRTMKSDCKAESEAPISFDDCRITRVGRFLRRSSIDELPQILNVLKGEMSFVGPRPEMCFLAAKYDFWQKQRLHALPGITGLWQISGRKDKPLINNIEYDVYYIANRSLRLDLWILIKTSWAVLHQRGAF